MNTQQCEACKQHENDLREAASELNISISEAPPGSTVCKLLMANSILRQKVSRLKTELAQVSWELEVNSDAIADNEIINKNW